MRRIGLRWKVEATGRGVPFCFSWQGCQLAGLPVGRVTRPGSADEICFWPADVERQLQVVLVATLRLPGLCAGTCHTAAGKSKRAERSCFCMQAPALAQRASAGSPARPQTSSCRRWAR